MNEAKDNPSRNTLPEGMTDEMLSAAVHRSGYPLQTQIAETFRELVDSVQEEWAFRDSDTGLFRALDIVAQVHYPVVAQAPVRPNLTLLVECKQSEYPFVFFLSSGTFRANFPALAGLRHNQLSLRGEDGETISITPQMALGTSDEPLAFHSDAAHTFTKARWKKKGELELSGAEPFNEVVFPLLKALRWFEKTHEPPETWIYFDLHAVLALAVVDAPMIGVTVTGETSEMRRLPWVRVRRHESDVDVPLPRNGRIVDLDVVHRDYLLQYLTKHVFPFGETFAARVEGLGDVLATGRGRLPPGADPWDLTDLHSRLLPDPEPDPRIY